MLAASEQQSVEMKQAPNRKLSGKAMTLHELPEECLVAIMRFLPATSMSFFFQSCSCLHQVSKIEAVWQACCYEDPSFQPFLRLKKTIVLEDSACSWKRFYQHFKLSGVTPLKVSDEFAPDPFSPDTRVLSQDDFGLTTLRHMGASNQEVLKFTGVIGGNRAVRTTQPWVIPAERQSNESTPMQTWICVLRKLFEPTSSLPLPERRFREQTLEKVRNFLHRRELQLEAIEQEERGSKQATEQEEGGAKPHLSGAIARLKSSYLDLFLAFKEEEGPVMEEEARYWEASRLTLFAQEAWQTPAFLNPVLLAPERSSDAVVQGRSEHQREQRGGVAGGGGVGGGGGGVERSRDAAAWTHLTLKMFPVRYYEITVLPSNSSEPTTALLGREWVLAVGLSTHRFPLTGRQPGWDAAAAALHSDDGRFFWGTTRARWPAFTFGPGDTVGCGLRLDTPVPLLFYTLNGRLQQFVCWVHGTTPNAFSNRHWWPTIGVDSLFEVATNFGAAPFAYDLRDPALWRRVESVGDQGDDDALVGRPDALSLGADGNGDWEVGEGGAQREAMKIGRGISLEGEPQFWVGEVPYVDLDSDDWDDMLEGDFEDGDQDMIAVEHEEPHVAGVTVAVDPQQLTTAVVEISDSEEGRHAPAGELTLAGQPGEVGGGQGEVGPGASTRAEAEEGEDDAHAGVGAGGAEPIYSATETSALRERARDDISGGAMCCEEEQRAA